jgi:hypothetical protein
MISFIIPTIYKSPRLIQLLYDLNSCDYVSEVLVIEDAPSNGMLNNLILEKVKVIPFTEKRYCNGAWNYGISQVKNYYYALCNDDINFNPKIIIDVINFYKQHPQTGFIGMHPSQFETQIEPFIYGFERKQNVDAVNGWGCLIFNHKLNDVIIPNDLKHWCGDTYYLNYSKFPNYSYLGEKIYTEMSTSLSPEVLKIGEHDQKTYIEKYLNK